VAGFDGLANAREAKSKAHCMAACLGRLSEFKELNAAKTISGNARIKIEERMALNEMKIRTTLV
jgi:hypothetical protein